MGSSTKKKWCHKTLTTCTIKGYHVLIILTLSLFTAFWIFQPSASNLTELLTTNERYKAKLNESKQALDTSIQQQSNLQYKEKALESSLDEKTKELNNLHSNNIKLKTHIQQLTQAKQQLENQSYIQKDLIKQLQHTAEKNAQNTPQTITSTTENESWYMKNYNQWIQGVGHHIMLNNQSNSNCFFPSDSFMLHKPPLINKDTLYEGATYCDKYRFSHIFDRVITVHCEYLQRQDPTKAGIKYYESDSIFNGRSPKPDDTQWVTLSFENGKRSHFAINLKDTTQTTWIYCNNAYDFHVSLVPLRKSDEKLYSNKKQKIADNFGEGKMPPNVVLFIMSAASRNNFMTAAVNSMHFLHSLQQNTNGKSPSDVVQFFRFSTVDAGTKNNLNALIAGKCIYCDLIDDNKCDGLASYYDRLGYYVWGLNEYRRNTRVQNDGLCDFFLGDNVTPRGCKFGHHIQVETGTEFVKQAIKVQRKYDVGVPHLMIINVQSNRVANGGMMYNLDRFIRNMIEMIRKENTVINIIGDHGPEILDDNLYSKLEYKNPVNIMLLPKWLRNDTNWQYLQLNQQRFIQHYDMHLFYKELLWKLYKKNELKSFSIANKKRDKLYQNMIFDDLPKVNKFPLSKSIMDEIIDINRDCKGISDGFCLCNTMKLKEINDELIADNIDYVQIIVKYINKLTGYGEWDCDQLNMKQFTIRIYIENREKTMLKIAISKMMDDSNEEEKLWKDKRLLAFYATFTKTNDNFEYELQNVMRINDMKYEECLTTDYDKQQFEYANDFDFGSDKQLKPMFINKETAVMMFKAYVNSNSMYKIDLKLCNCKEINLKDITVIKSLGSRKKEDKIETQLTLHKRSQEIFVHKVNEEKNVSVIEEIKNKNEKVDTIYENVNRNRRGKRKRVNKNGEDDKSENDAAENDTSENESEKAESDGNNIRSNEREENESEKTESDGNNEENDSEKDEKNENDVEENDSEENENDVEESDSEKNENDNRSNKVQENEGEKTGSEKNEVEGNDSDVGDEQGNDSEKNDREEDDVRKRRSKENEAKEKNSDAFETDDVKIKREARKQKRLEKRNARNGKRSNVLDDLVEKGNDGKELNNDNKGSDEI